MKRATGETNSATPSMRKAARRSPKIPRIARVVQRLGRMIPEEEWRGIPKDLSSQVDHYVYGLPKR